MCFYSNPSLLTGVKSFWIDVKLVITMFKGKLVFAILLSLFNAPIHSKKSNEALRVPDERACIPVRVKFAMFFEKNE